MRASLALIFVLLLSAFTCVPEAAGQTRRGRARARRAQQARPAAETVAKNSAVTTTPTGLTIVLTRKTQGRQPRAGETVSVHYTGLLTSGVRFDSSLDRGQPISFKLGTGRVIKGWDEGIARLRVGEQATLIIPPELGYGEKGAGGGVIPPGATLIFVVELVGVEDAPAAN